MLGGTTRVIACCRKSAEAAWACGRKPRDKSESSWSHLKASHEDAKLAAEAAGKLTTMTLSVLAPTNSIGFQRLLALRLRAFRFAAAVCPAAIRSRPYRTSRWWRDVYLPAIFPRTNRTLTSLRVGRAAVRCRVSHNFLSSPE